jgi:transposase
MFISKKRTKNNPHVYVQLVESYRNADKKVRQRVIKHIGSAATDDNLEKVIALAGKVKEMILNGSSKDIIDPYLKQELSKINGSKNYILNCEPVKTINKGISDVYGATYDAMRLTNIITSKTNYNEILKYMVLGRIVCLGSKKKLCEEIHKKFDKEYNLNSIYRTMDKINAELIEKIQAKINKYNKSLLRGDINVLFYDATTIYFESFTDDELRKLGYSKDLKFNQPQIVFTMLVTNEGLPLAYQIFPGNTYEGNTLQTALKEWQKLYPEQKITLVADSGMLNSANLEYLEENGFGYIVCARLKSLNKDTKYKICESKKCHEGDYFYEINFDNRRLIISYRDNRAKKDRLDREKNINALRKKISKSSSPANLISNYGYKKFITVDSKSRVLLNEEKIEESAKWDGLHGVITNITDLSSEEVYSHYRGLYQIEDAFRINKTDLKIRPIFHWTPSRVQAHLAISYIAFCCYKAVEFTFNKSQLSEKLSHRKIREILEETQVAIYKDRYSGEQFNMPLPIPTMAKVIYKSQNLNLDITAHKIVA